MAINTAKVVTGGVVAGIVGNIVGYLLFGMLLGPRMEAELVAAARRLEALRAELKVYQEFQASDPSIPRP